MSNSPRKLDQPRLIYKIDCSLKARILLVTLYYLVWTYTYTWAMTKENAQDVGMCGTLVISFESSNFAVTLFI